MLLHLSVCLLSIACRWSRRQPSDDSFGLTSCLIRHVLSSLHLFYVAFRSSTEFVFKAPNCKTRNPMALYSRHNTQTNFLWWVASMTLKKASKECKADSRRFLTLEHNSEKGDFTLEEFNLVRPKVVLLEEDFKDISDRGRGKKGAVCCQHQGFSRTTKSLVVSINLLMRVTLDFYLSEYPW